MPHGTFVKQFYIINKLNKPQGINTFILLWDYLNGLNNNI